MALTEEKMDAYQDLLKGIGGPNDTTLTTAPIMGPILPDYLLASYWSADGLAKKIVTAPVDDAIRPWFEIEGSDNSKRLSDEIKRLRLRQALKAAFHWRRLYGGALICLGYADGQDVSMPANPGKPISFIEVYPRTAVQLTGINLESNPANPRYGRAKEYPIQPTGLMTGTIQNWHWSRCIEVLGEQLPKDALSTTSANLDAYYWGVSILQGLTQGLNTLGTALQGVGYLLREASVGKYALHGLNTMLAGPNGASLIKKRLTAMNTGKSILNAIILDAGSTGATSIPAETYSRETVTFVGIPETLNSVAEFGISGPSNIPVSKLLGRQTTGLGTADEGSMRNYYDMVRELQTNELDWVAVEIVTRINDYVKEVPEGKLGLKWKHPNEPSQAEMVDMRSKQATTDKVYLDSGVVDADELRSNRFEGEASLETTVTGPAPDIEVEELPNTATPVPGKPAKAPKAPKK